MKFRNLYPKSKLLCNHFSSPESVGKEKIYIFVLWLFIRFCRQVASYGSISVTDFIFFTQGVTFMV